MPEPLAIRSLMQGVGGRAGVGMEGSQAADWSLDKNAEEEQEQQEEEELRRSDKWLEHLWPGRTRRGPDVWL